ncbi:MAG: hypothetical protein ABJQ70_14990 [Roseobacter sp.]
MSIFTNEEGESRIPDWVGGGLSFSLGVATKGRSLCWGGDLIEIQRDATFEALGNSTDFDLTARDGYRITGTVVGGYLGGLLAGRDCCIN